MGFRRQYLLGDLGRIVTGRTPAKAIEDAYGGDVPFVTPSDMDDRKVIDSTARYLTQSGFKAVQRAEVPARAVMVSCIGSDMGKAAMTSERCVTNQQINTIIVEEQFDPDYVYYDLSTRKAELQRVASGAAQPILNKSAFSELPIELPPLSEQRAIAEVLGSLDDKIALNRRMNRTLESMARALFKSWFVDFDPVHANAAGQPTLPPDLAALFPAAFESSTLEEVPEGWEVKPIGELCDINARTLRKKDKLDQLEYVEISAANRGDIESIPHYDRDDAPGRARRRLRHGDVAVSTVRPDRGAYFLALNPPEHRIASTGFAVMSPRVPFSFLFVLMTRPETSEKLGQLADGAAYPAVKPEQIEAIEAVAPNDPAILNAFHAVVEPLLERMEKNRQESRILAALRDALLPHLLGGNLRPNISLAQMGCT